MALIVSPGDCNPGFRMPKAAPMVNWPRFAKRRASPSGIQDRALPESGFAGDGDFRGPAHPPLGFLAFLQQLARFGTLELAQTLEG
jgi:hypothetical protein